MNELERNTPKTPTITKEAKLYDTLGTIQEGIRMADRLNDMVRATEIEEANKPKEQPKETPIVTADDIRRAKQDDEREIY